MNRCKTSIYAALRRPNTPFDNKQTVENISSAVFSTNTLAHARMEKQAALQMIAVPKDCEIPHQGFCEPSM